MTQVGNTAAHNQKELKTRWPIESGLTAGTQKQTGKVMNLIPSGLHGVTSTVPQRKKVGL